MTPPLALVRKDASWLPRWCIVVGHFLGTRDRRVTTTVDGIAIQETGESEDDLNQNRISLSTLMNIRFNVASAGNSYCVLRPVDKRRNKSMSPATSVSFIGVSGCS